MDLSHGHPPSLSSRGHQRSQQTFHRDTEPATPSPPSTQHSDLPFSLQNRRLQLRNVGFRATKVSSQRLGVKISRFFNGPEIPQSEPAPLRNQENSSPQTRSTHSLRSGQRTSTTLSILQEISNSTRSRYSQKRSRIPIAEDNPERPLLDISPAATTPTTWYHDASSTQQSPLDFHTIDAGLDTMKLREISGNERRSPPPLSSPLARQVRGRKKRGLDLRRTTFEASEYIEHIENELQRVNEAMHSPNTGKPLKEKLKILQAENMQLMDTISRLEETFDERLKQAVEHKAAVEAEMRKKIKALEDELISKENIISDFEHDRDESRYDGGCMDALRAMIDRLEQDKERLEEANRVVEKRNEALTGLLAQSPTRSHHGFELVSPIRQDLRRTPRPKSMMITKISSPPRSEIYQRPRSVQICPAHSSTGYFDLTPALELGHESPCHIVAEVDGEKTSNSESLDSGLGNPCSAQSPVREGSRRSSTASHASTTPSAWGLPLPASPSNDKAAVKQNKHRRTRRFESGSTQLKPLLLPTMACENTAFQMSYTASPSSSPTHREFSEQSLDPTISFLSQPSETLIQRPASPLKWVSEAALKALEGSPEPQFETFEDIIARYDTEMAGLVSSPISHQISDNADDADGQEIESRSYVDDSAVEEDVTVLFNQPDSRVTKEEMFPSFNDEASFDASKQDSLWKNEQDLTSTCIQSNYPAPCEAQRLSENRLDSDCASIRQVSIDNNVELIPGPILLPNLLNTTGSASNRIHQSMSLILASCSVDDSPIPRKRQRSSDPDNCSFVMPTLCINPGHETNGHERLLSDTYMGSCNASTQTSQKPRSSKSTSRPRNPFKTLHQRNLSPTPLTSVTIRTIFGTVSRYTSYVREIRRDPTALARRVLANAWHSNWKRLGKLSWWVLGLFFGPGRQTGHFETIKSTGWDWGRYDGEAIAEDVCESKIRAAERPVSSQQPLLTASDLRLARFDGSDPDYRTAETRAKAKPAFKPDDHEQKEQRLNWRKSLLLWGKFSVALMLAIGGAVMNGPEEMLKDCDEQASRKNGPPAHQQVVNEPQHSRPSAEVHTPTDVTDIPVAAMNQPAKANNALPATSKQLSEESAASSGPARSIFDTGVGATPGTVELGRSSLRTPSPARQRRQAALSTLGRARFILSDLRMVTKEGNRSSTVTVEKQPRAGPIRNAEPTSPILRSTTRTKRGSWNIALGAKP